MNVPRSAGPSRWSSARRLAAVVVPPFGLLAIVIGLWYFVSYVVLIPLRRFLLRPPHEVVATGFLDGHNFVEIITATWSSLQVAFIGLTLSFLLGVGIAVLMSQSKLVERAVFPFMVTLQAVPILAIVPLISFWRGTGQEARVIVCVIISIFPIVLNTLFGLVSADPGLHDLATLHGAGRLTRLRKVMFPAALPAMFAGLRISAGLSVIGAIVGDFFFGRGDVGIGQRIRQYSLGLDGEKLVASVIVTSLLGVAVFLAFGALQTRMIGKWYDAKSGSGR
ncbi:ABC transporter permease [soil metagenome]